MLFYRYIFHIIGYSVSKIYDKQLWMDITASQVSGSCSEMRALRQNVIPLLLFGFCLQTIFLIVHKFVLSHVVFNCI